MTARDDSTDTNERLSADDMATRREAEFLARAMLNQQAAAPQQMGRPGTCSNCSSACLPLAVYCDDDCRQDHQARVLPEARTGRRGHAR